MVHALLVVALTVVVGCGADEQVTGNEVNATAGDDASDTSGLSQDTGAADTGSADTGAADTAEEDTGPNWPAPVPCKSNLDCPTQACMQTPAGKMCATACVDSCPPESTCIPIQSSGDVVYVCAHDAPFRCAPCAKDADCAGEAKTKGRCVDLGPGGSCLQTCSADTDCVGEGFVCGVPASGGDKVCLPPDNVCPCPAGATGGCKIQNQYGTCLGAYTCVDGKPSECSGPAPAAETCNGKDDDCDGQTDEDVPANDCSLTNVYGTCAAKTVCVGGKELCQGANAAAEVCNGIDDNCSGVTDDGFPDTDKDGKADCIDNDDDEDGVDDGTDVCPLAADPSQTDTDKDGKGDACDPDDDDDTVPDGKDVCPLVADPKQIDTDNDGWGDPCDCDPDGDGAFSVGLDASGVDCPTPATPDNCLLVANVDQADLDADGAGDACDDDDDGDKVADGKDVCPMLADPDQKDSDGDGKGNACDDDDDGDGVLDEVDVCPLTVDPTQTDTDSDGKGDLCDDDLDGDDVPNDKDNCKGKPNPKQEDQNKNGIGDLCEDDWDGDGKLNGDDNCPWAVNADQADMDGDKIGDVCDCDIDGDAVNNIGAGCAAPDAVDNCPLAFNVSQTDIDNDGTGDECDADKDGDGDGNETDCAPNDKSVSNKAQESCNTVDDDCDGTTDEQDAKGCKVFHLDEDGDGWGVAVFQCLCAATPPYSASQSGDCNDKVGEVNPDAVEVCGNGKDDNCNGSENDQNAKGCSKLYYDSDGDGYGTADSQCLCGAAGSYSAKQGGDCQDTDLSVSPGQPEKCKDDKDNDCDSETDEAGCQGCTTYFKDEDGDGYGAVETQCLSNAAPPYSSLKPGDCNDKDKTANPTVAESCNGKDDDCDGQTDETGAKGCVNYYVDADGDTFGTGTAACLCKPIGNQKATKAGDCDDQDKTVKPGAKEICGNGKDDNCVGGESEIDATGCTTYYLDADGDGRGVGAGKCLCAPQGQLTAKAGDDCKDDDAKISPVLPEVCPDDKDNNCNGATDEEGCTGCTTYLLDADSDGFGVDGSKKCLAKPTAPYTATAGGDCNDGDKAINPKAKEACNAKDDDCDSQTDEDDSTGCKPYFTDADVDTFGTGASRCLCKATGVWTASKDGDCNDKDKAVSPAAKEVCGNGKDDNCNGSENDVNATGCVAFYADSDGDGYGVGTSSCLCSATGAYSAKKAGDCDDKDGGINPGQVEKCLDNKDNNCSGSTDEAGCQGCQTMYKDADADGYGLDKDTSCLGQPKYPYTAFVAGDCNDASPNVKPGALELCNNVDDNCDGAIDPIGTSGCQNFYPDVDKDGFGANVAPACYCKATGTYVVNKTGDCDDNNALSYPGKAEICDGFDNNCNGQVDENVQTAYYKDNDGDGIGSGAPTYGCKPKDASWVLSGADCNDFSKTIYPGAKELCNDIDDNCNSLKDEGLTTAKIYKDNDGDGWAPTGALSQDKCDVPVGWTKPKDFDGDGKNDWDCDDSDTTSYPGAPDLCGDGKDNDCDGSADKLCFDSCGGSWPFQLKVSGGNSAAQPIDLDGDGNREVVVQDSFGFALLDSDGVASFEYSAPVYNYARTEAVFADVDGYDKFSAGTQTLEVLTANGSVGRMYRVETDGVHEYTDTNNSYDASRSMAWDMDGDGSPELLTSTWCQKVGVRVLRFDRAAKKFQQVGSIDDPNGVCQYNDGRILHDMDGDGVAELVFGNGYPGTGNADNPDTWGGNIFAYKLSDPAKMLFAPFCAPAGTCAFPTAIANLFGVRVNEIIALPAGIYATVQYSATKVKGQPNTLTTRYWGYDILGKALANMPATSAVLSPTDVDDDGVIENVSDTRTLGLWDVDGDGYPDRIYTSGQELRVALWVPAKKTFVEHVPSRQVVSATGIGMRGITDMDADGQLDVLVADGDGKIHCRELGAKTFNRYTSLPPYITPVMRTWKWDNFEPNEGQDINKDGIPDRYVRIPSAMTRKGDFYSYLTSDTDVDTYQIDASWGGTICLRAPKARQYKMEVYSFADKTDASGNTPADGKPDGKVYEVTTAAGGSSCFSGASVYPPRYGEYRFLVKISSVKGSSAYWPYWITAAK